MQVKRIFLSYVFCVILCDLFLPSVGQCQTPTPTPTAKLVLDPTSISGLTNLKANPNPKAKSKDQVWQLTRSETHGDFFHQSGYEITIRGEGGDDCILAKSLEGQLGFSVEIAKEKCQKMIEQIKAVVVTTDSTAACKWLLIWQRKMSGQILDPEQKQIRCLDEASSRQKYSQLVYDLEVLLRSF